MNKEIIPSITVGAIVLDCESKEIVADFYQKLLGWDKVTDKDDWIDLASPDRKQVIAFQEIGAGYVRPEWPEVAGKQQQMIPSGFYGEKCGRGCRARSSMWSDRKHNPISS